MPDPAGRRLLVVDDDRLVCEMVKDHFENSGFAVDTASDPQDAIGKLPAGYDAILSDVLMPKLTGLELLQHVREKTPKALVFLMTARPSINTLNLAKQLGAVAYFRKPLKLPEVEARVRGFLGEENEAAVHRRVLVIGPNLLERLADRLDLRQTAVAPPEEAAFLGQVAIRRPQVVLADAADPATPPLLQAYRTHGHATNAFLLVGDPAALEGAGELLRQGATGCIPVGAPRPLLEKCLSDAIAYCDARSREHEAAAEPAQAKCCFARAYRNGYYCVAPGDCTQGGVREGWAAIDGKEHPKCGRRPLLVPSLAQTGFARWSGEIDPAQAMQHGKALFRLVREGRRILVIDALGLTTASYNLCEALADAAAELESRDRTGLIHVINLSEAPKAEFRRAVSNKGVRFHGSRMVDERSAFARWGTRFD